MTRTGRCRCGAVTYELTGDLIAMGVCHCDHCQRQSGGAFSVNLVAHESQLSVAGSLKTYDERGEQGDDVDVRPTVQVWCVDRQPWVDLPGMQVSMDRE